GRIYGDGSVTVTDEMVAEALRMAGVTSKESEILSANLKKYADADESERPSIVKAAAAEIKPFQRTSEQVTRSEVRFAMTGEDGMTRQSAMNAALMAAAGAVQEAGFEGRVPLAPGARSAEIHLTELIMSLREQGVAVPDSVSPDKGIYIAQYNKALIEQAIARRNAGIISKDVVIVALVRDRAEADFVRKKFAGRIEVAVGDVNEAVATQIKLIGLLTLGNSLVQVKPGAKSADNELAYLTAALLANGRIVVVGTEQTVTGAVQITVAQMVQAQLEATQSIARSA
ncbi:MAG TPA: hypothetical protein PK997_07175, partial [Candidatus Omnitrophota bacterium]|nr:hypothetical protein [Candidatus Omnitrophota bacterium]